MVKYLTADGQRLVYPPGDDVATFLNAGWYEFREIGFFYRFLRKGDRFLDVGAHCGLYSAIAKAVVGKSGYVLAIEPGGDLAAYLCQNLGISGPAGDLSALTGEGCEWLQAAAMDQPGTVYLSADATEKSAYRDVSLESAAGNAVTAFTGDQIALQLGQGFDLVKVDVEGVEGLVLAGLVETLTRFPATVLMIEFTEANQTRHEGSTEALASRVREMGLGLFEFDDVACRLVEIEDGSALEHKNLFACRQPDEVNKRLQTTPPKQILYAEETFERGRASEQLYFETLLFKNFRARAAGWLRQIAGSLRYLRGDAEDASHSLGEKAHKIEASRTVGERANALAALIEDSLGQLEGTSAYLAESFASEREEHVMLKRQVAEAEALIVRDLRLESPSLEMAIRASIETLASDLLLLKEVSLALPSGRPDSVGHRLDAYLARVQREISETVTNRIELQRLKPVMLAASEQLREAKAREAAIAAAKAEAELQMAQQAAELTRITAVADQEQKRADRLQAENANLKSELASALSYLDDERRKLEASLAEMPAMEARLAEVTSQLSERDQRLEDVLQETDRLFGELNREHEAELGELRTAVQEAKAAADRLEVEHSLAQADLARKSAQLSDISDIIRECARELGNLAFDARSDHEVIRDLVRSVRASRVATLAAVLGTGPRRATTQMMDRTAAARAKISEILLKADFLKSVSGQLAQPEVPADAEGVAIRQDSWSVYGSAVEVHGRDRREAINLLAREDLQAIGRSIVALRRSRFMGLAATFGLQVSKELDRLYEIYCANEAH